MEQKTLEQALVQIIEKAVQGVDAAAAFIMHNTLPALLEAVEALEAVKARASGEFDNPSLLKYGELGVTSDDVVRIANSALEKLK